MARKPEPSSSSSRTTKPVAKQAAGKTQVRNTPVPRATTTAPANRSAAPASANRQVSREQIAKRAYEIWQSGTGGSEFENWVRAERELRG